MKRISSFIAGLLVGAMLFGGGAVYAASGVLAERSAQAVYVDGRRVELEAYFIDGANYVKLRDIGQAVDFNVFWDGAVQIESSAPYTGEAPTSETHQDFVDYSAAVDPAVFTSVYTREAYNAAYEVLAGVRAGDLSRTGTVHFDDVKDCQQYQIQLAELANGTTLSLRSLSSDAYEVYAHEVDRRAAEIATEDFIYEVKKLSTDTEKIVRVNEWLCEHKTGASQPGTAGTGESSGTRKTSVDGKTTRPGIAGTGAGSKNRAAAIRGMASRPGTAGTGTTGGKAPGEGQALRPGTAGTGGSSSEQTVHGGAQAPANGTAGVGTQGATRFTNAPRMAQNQTVQNSVQSAQQSAVTLEGAKQTPAGSAGKTPPPAAPGAGANAGGKDSRFTQRPATAQAAPSGTGLQPGTAGTAAGSQNPQTSQTARESQRTGGSVAPAGASAPGTARQESRISRQSGTNAGNKRGAPNMSGSGKRAAPSGASAQPKSRPGHPSVTGDSGKRAGSATARQESRATARNPSAAKGMASVQRPGMAGTAPPAARPSRKGQDKTRPPKPEETASDVRENTNGVETVPTESEKEDGGDE